jgi:hypothetical protein
VESNSAWWATSGVSPANSRKARKLDSGGGAARNSSSSNPVSRRAMDVRGFPGGSNAWNAAAGAPPSNRIAASSIMDSVS